MRVPSGVQDDRGDIARASTRRARTSRHLLTQLRSKSEYDVLSSRPRATGPCISGGTSGFMNGM